MKEEKESTEGTAMWQLVNRLWPICRSITGEGLRMTLRILQEQIPIKLVEVPTGTKVFDWVVPNEWNIQDAYILNEAGEKIIDFKVSNLHVVGYSCPYEGWMELDELQNHLHSIESQPDAIPYITSYYKEYWGFCLSHNQRKQLKSGKYFVHIDSTLKPGSLTYGELILKGESQKEIFISTYVCHPSMGNNELSGPAVVSQLAKWIGSEKRKYTYRIVFIPETIGSITYLAKHYKEMKQNVIAGFNVSCVGDTDNYSVVKSRYGNTLADRIVKRTMSDVHPEFKEFSFLDRGSDERQYCSPGIDLPLVTVCRTKYGEYAQYHTSLDNLSYICEEGLVGSYDLLKRIVLNLEDSKFYRINTLGEPQLGKRNLYPDLSTKNSVASVKRMMNFIAYLDGTNELSDISTISGIPVSELELYLKVLQEHGLVEEIDYGS